MTAEPTNVRPSIRMGEFAVAAGGVVLRTLLGSCLGIALYDHRSKTGGLAHVVLPHSKGATQLPAKFVDTAIPALIEEMGKVAGSRLDLTAKLAGGANMFKGSGAKRIGQQNIEAADCLLTALGVPIVARHLGGERGRRMLLDTETGRVMIEVVGADAVEL